MDCTALLKRSEQQLLAGNVTAADAALELVDCFPQVCDQVFGSTDFDLAGSGVFISIVIQVVLFIVFGTIQSYGSQCISTRAGRRTQLALARFQAVNDTIFSTGFFFALALLITTYIRAGQDGVGALEKSIMRDFIGCQQMLLNLAMATRWVQRKPANAKSNPRSWSEGGVYLTSQGLGLLAWSVKKRIDKIPTTGADVAPKLCSLMYEYPHLNSGPAAAGTNPFIIGLALGLLMILAGALLSLMLPRLWKWLEKVFESRPFWLTAAALFTIMCLFSVIFTTLHLYWTRKDLENIPAWNFTQVFAVLLWLRPVWHIIVAMLSLTTLSEDQSKKASSELHGLNAVIKRLYSSSFEEPSFEPIKPGGCDVEHKQLSDLETEKTAQTQSEARSTSSDGFDEKAKLIDDTASPDEQPRSSSPSGMV